MPPITPRVLHKLAAASKAGPVIVSSKLMNDLFRHQALKGRVPDFRSAVGVQFVSGGGRQRLLPVVPQPGAGPAIPSLLTTAAITDLARRARRQGVGSTLGAVKRPAEVPAGAFKDIRTLARAGRNQRSGRS